MSGDELTRRRMMRDATAAVGAATLAGSAGCLGSLPFVGGGAGAYKKWLPDPGELDRVGDHYQFRYKDMSSFADSKDEFDSSVIENFEEWIESIWWPAGFDWDETSDIVNIAGSYVVEGEFSKDEVVEDLKDEHWEEDTDYGGFTILLKPDEDSGMAVSDGTVVIPGAFKQQPVDIVEPIIDVSNGDVDRYVDENEDMNALLGALGGGTLVGGGTMDEIDDGKPEVGRFDHQVAEGRKMTVNGETIKWRNVVVYEEKENVDTDELEEWVEENGNRYREFENLEDVSYKQNGRLGIIEGTKDTDEYR